MPFNPHTDDDVRAMLDVIGVSGTDELFEEIPPALRIEALPDIPAGLTEMEITRHMHALAARDGMPLNFIGAGAYEHHIPAAVWQITTRGEFYSAYTPYQAEASQGTLQLLYEYQTMMTRLTAMDVSNASLYDGASGLGEAVLMAVRANRKSKSRHVLCAGTVHPRYRDVTRVLTEAQGVTIDELALDDATGNTVVDALAAFDGQDITAVIIQQPNFFGMLEEVDELTDWAHRNGALVIAVVNPMSLALLKPPGEWGEAGADIACGEGQPLGVPLSSGGPYFGFLTCRQAHVRQMPGRIVGATVDLDGQRGFTLTLQAREQHIRRSKATSNICTNQGLMVTAATIYMSLLGPEGLARVAAASHNNTVRLAERLSQLPGVTRRFEGDLFHEVAIEMDRPAAPVIAALAKRGIAAGFDLSRDYPQLGHAMLVCATETKTDADIEAYAVAFRDALKAARVA